YPSDDFPRPSRVAPGIVQSVSRRQRVRGIEHMLVKAGDPGPARDRAAHRRPVRYISRRQDLPAELGADDRFMDESLTDIDLPLGLHDRQPRASAGPAGGAV